MLKSLSYYNYSNYMGSFVMVLALNITVCKVSIASNIVKPTTKQAVAIDKSKKSNKQSTTRRTKLKHVENRTVNGVLPKKYQQLPQLLETAINSYCNYNLQTLKKVTLPAYWPKAEKEIVFENSIDNDKGRAYVKNMCFEWFKVEQFIESTGRITGKSDSPTVLVLMRAFQKGESSPDGYGYRVLFSREPLKYIRIGSPFGISADFKLD